MAYTANQIKVYENSGLILYEELNLKTLETNYQELVDLIELFGYKENSSKKKSLRKREQEISKKYKPLIQEAKRILRNTQKRLDYNSAKC